MNLHRKTIVVTGGAGFLGRHVVDHLSRLGVPLSQIRIPRSADCDLRRPGLAAAVIAGADLVIHLASVVGGIGFNRTHPGRIFYDNALINLNTLEASRLAKVQKFVGIGTVCSYPKNTPVPFLESDLWNGYPEETNAPYGLAKKMLLVQQQAYCREYNFKSIYLMPVNLYGPGDNFSSQSSHVIPALIKKFVEAKQHQLPEVEVWGTGRASREFLYVEDAAEAIVKACQEYEDSEPVNIGSGQEMTIAALAEIIKRQVGYSGQIKFNPTYPDGQPRRCLDISKAKQLFGFTATTPFETGLKKTLDWYLQSL